jgi:hypothetical protein
MLRSYKRSFSSSLVGKIDRLSTAWMKLFRNSRILSRSEKSQVSVLGTQPAIGRTRGEGCMAEHVSFVDVL